MYIIINRICQYIAYLAGWILFSMIIVIVYGAIARNMNWLEPAWIKDYTSYGLTWSSILAMAVLTWFDDHLSLNVFGQYLSPFMDKLTKLPIYVIFACVMAILTKLTYAKALREKTTYISSLMSVDIQLSMFWVYIALPIGCGLMVIFSVLRFFYTVNDLGRMRKV